MGNKNWQFTRIAGLLFLGVIAAIAVSSWARQKGNDDCPRRENQTLADVTGFYCNVKALGAAEWVRHWQLGRELKQARMETKELADGFAFRLDSAKAPLADVAEWVAGERRCCPFFDFEIALERDGGPLWLKLRGKEGVKQFISDEFDAGH